MARTTSNKKRTKLNVTTPVGVFAFPYIDRPCTKFAGKDNPDGEFKVDVVIDPDDPGLAPLEKKLQELASIRKKEIGLDESTKVALPIKPHMDSNKSETGKLVIRCRTNACLRFDGEPPIRRKVTVLDSGANVVAPAPAIGPGTEGRVLAIATANYFEPDDTLFVKLAPDAVQIAKLIERGQFSKERYAVGWIDGDFDGAATPVMVPGAESDEAPLPDTTSDRRF